MFVFVIINEFENFFLPQKLIVSTENEANKVKYTW